jgi:hypothetical protein
MNISGPGGEGRAERVPPAQAVASLEVAPWRRVHICQRAPIPRVGL